MRFSYSFINILCIKYNAYNQVNPVSTNLRNGEYRRTEVIEYPLNNLQVLYKQKLSLKSPLSR